jgi:hypothetical protein
VASLSFKSFFFFSAQCIFKSAHGKYLYIALPVLLPCYFNTWVFYLFAALLFQHLGILPVCCLCYFNIWVFYLLLPCYFNMWVFYLFAALLFQHLGILPIFCLAILTLAGRDGAICTVPNSFFAHTCCSLSICTVPNSNSPRKARAYLLGKQSFETRTTCNEQ